jgi:hypothetical protein
MASHRRTAVRVGGRESVDGIASADFGPAGVNLTRMPPPPYRNHPSPSNTPLTHPASRTCPSTER